MILCIDIGNTHVVIGLFVEGELAHSWRLQSDSERTVDEYSLEILSLLNIGSIDRANINQVIISCVVPTLSRVFQKLSTKYFNKTALFVGPGLRTGLKIACDDPRSVGADRICNAVAAKELFGAPAIVVDFGTATTFDVISASGTYEGGIIAPGIVISANALFERAAQLPQIELSKATRLIGKNTKDAMLSGIFFGYQSLVEGVLNRVIAEVSGKPIVVATGGLSSIFADESKFIDKLMPDLTLQGLQLIAKMNSE
jgi:type III pantothenate kinase